MKQSHSKTQTMFAVLLALIAIGSFFVTTRSIQTYAAPSSGPAGCSAPRVTTDVSRWIDPTNTTQTNRFLVEVHVNRTQTGCNLTSGQATVTLPHFAEYDGHYADLPGILTITGSGQTATVSMSDPQGITGWGARIWAKTPSVDQMPQIPPTGFVTWVGSSSGPQSSVSFNVSEPTSMFYTKPKWTRLSSGPVNPGDEVTFKVETQNYPHAPSLSATLRILAPQHTTFVPGSFTGLDGGTITDTGVNGLAGKLIDWGTLGQDHVVTYKLRIDPNIPPTVTQITLGFLTQDYEWSIPPARGKTEKMADIPMQIDRSPGVTMRRPEIGGITQQSLTAGLVAIDAPLEFSNDPAGLVQMPSVTEGLVADDVTPLLFQIELPESAFGGGAQYQYRVAVELVSGGTVAGDLIADRLFVLKDGAWGTDRDLTFTSEQNRKFAYLAPIRSDDVHFSDGETELSLRLKFTTIPSGQDAGEEVFRIRKPPIALVHGYNTDGTWGPNFKSVLGSSRPEFDDSQEDFIRTIRYGQLPEDGAVTQKENTVLPFSPLARMLEIEMEKMTDDIKTRWAMSRH
ncbi:MAG: hypothetical protein AB7J13_04195, partial [Pyrinomonadaceae bacterium]